MNNSKRIFDLLIAIMLGILLLPIIIIISIVILIFDGRPIFYVSERMATPNTAFLLLKFRTMIPGKDNTGVTGANKSNRITLTGKFLRKTRFDELPQIWNILLGDMSFVGPRPPLREYVYRFPHYYNDVLRSRPGVTGLASIVYHRHEERILGKCKTATETDEVYARSCIPTKAKLDLIYQKNQNLCFDILLMVKTIIRTIPIRRKTND
jgi:lipopolysaccharide/colanic/teichoic acid biosynthesis glycosyltransferase